MKLADSNNQKIKFVTFPVCHHRDEEIDKRMTKARQDQKDNRDSIENIRKEIDRMRDQINTLQQMIELLLRERA